MKLTKLISEITEAPYNKMFDPETLGNLKNKTVASRQDMLGNANIMQVVVAMTNALPKVMDIEAPYIDELEPLAVEIVKEAYPIIDYAGIEIDAKIVNFAGVQQLDDESVPNDIESEDFDNIKRRIINAITQGASVRGAFNYNLIFREYLDQLNPHLVDEYNSLMKNVFGIFDDDQALAMMLSALAQQNKIEGGSEEIDWEEGTLKITARAVCFPMLVHEIVKGLFEILSLQGFGADLEKNKQVVKTTDKLVNEPEDMRYGKFIYDAISKIFKESDFEDTRIRELLFTELYKLDDENFKKFIDNSINDRLLPSQKKWALDVMKDIEKDLKSDDTGLNEIESIPNLDTIKTNTIKYVEARVNPNAKGTEGYKRLINIINKANNLNDIKDFISSIFRDSETHFQNVLKMKESKSLTELFDLNEYSQKIIDQMTALYAAQGADEAEIKTYISRFDQLKAKLKQGHDSNDSKVMSLIPKDLLDKNRYLDILQWKNFEALKKAIIGLSKKNEDPYKQAIDFFLKDRNLEEPIIKFYVARFKKIVKDLEQRVKDKDASAISLIPQELLKNGEYKNILNWRNFHQLERLLDAEFPPDATEQEEINSAMTDADKVYEGNGIEIYQGNSQDRCVKYGHGMGNSYSWCISRKDSSNMYSSYRFMGDRSRMFYFVFDRSRPSAKSSSGWKDKYHVIVIHVFEHGQYAVTDANNPGEDIVPSWEQLSKYMPSELWNKIKNLKEVFKYIPPSKAEKEIAALKGKTLTLDQFAELSYETKLAYINGGAKLNADQINLLDVDLKNQYINLGNVMPFETISDNLPLIKRYITIHFDRKDKPVAAEYLNYMSEESKQKYYEKFKDESYLNYDHMLKYFPEYLNDYINEYLKYKMYLPESYYNHMTSEQKNEYYQYSPAFDNTNIIILNDGENQIPNYYLMPSIITSKQFISLEPKHRRIFAEFLKELIQEGKFEDMDSTPYLTLYQCIPQNKKIKNGKLYLKFEDIYKWIDEDGKIIEEIKENYENWDKYMLKKKAGLIK